MNLRDKVFASVFPAPSEVDVPTPAATPILGSSAFGEPFGSPNLSQSGHESDAAEQIKWDRAWHTATTYLALGNESIRADQDEKTLRGKWIKAYAPQMQKAIQYIVSPESLGRQIRKEKDDLLRWYFEEAVLGHYVEHALPGLKRVYAAAVLVFGVCLMESRF